MLKRWISFEFRQEIVSNFDYILFFIEYSSTSFVSSYILECASLPFLKLCASITHFIDFLNDTFKYVLSTLISNVFHRQNTTHVLTHQRNDIIRFLLYFFKKYSTQRKWRFNCYICIFLYESFFFLEILREAGRKKSSST